MSESLVITVLDPEKSQTPGSADNGTFSFASRSRRPSVTFLYLPQVKKKGVQHCV